jgi:hypothetical protein
MVAGSMALIGAAAIKLQERTELKFKILVVVVEVATKLGFPWIKSRVRWRLFFRLSFFAPTFLFEAVHESSPKSKQLGSPDSAD